MGVKKRPTFVNLYETSGLYSEASSTFFGWWDKGKVVMLSIGEVCIAHAWCEFYFSCSPISIRTTLRCYKDNYWSSWLWGRHNKVNKRMGCTTFQLWADFRKMSVLTQERGCKMITDRLVNLHHFSKSRHFRLDGPNLCLPTSLSDHIFS